MPHTYIQSVHGIISAPNLFTNFLPPFIIRKTYLLGLGNGELESIFMIWYKSGLTCWGDSTPKWWLSSKGFISWWIHILANSILGAAWQQYQVKMKIDITIFRRSFIAKGQIISEAFFSWLQISQKAKEFLKVFLP